MRKFINTSLIVAILGIIFILAGCSHKAPPEPVQQTVVTPEQTPVGTEVQVPEWFAKLPSAPDYLYAAATIVSRDMGLASEHGANAGRMELSRQVATKVMSLMKRFQEETGVGEDAELLSMMTTVSESVASEVVRGTKPVEQKIFKESPRTFRAYVLMELPIGIANSALMDKIKENKNMYTRFRASQAFQELEDEVEKYEQFKKEQEEGTKTE